ncbi:MAG: group II intron reverse transcriptase domain-containing protein [Parcubacteria group bacterium]|nr:group II intron reverse transcriptase domain-containing protein [Parcubacteria group bacterium]
MYASAVFSRIERSAEALGGGDHKGKKMKKQCSSRYEDIISIENLLAAWQEFVRGKRGKRDVLQFSRHLTDEIVALHHDFTRLQYRHSSYEHFVVHDPKRRDIHKASVRDRLVHHAVYRIIYPFFDGTFIADSFSCRLGKGTHKALNRFRSLAYQASHNHTRTVWVLQCDIRKFFDSIDHAILLRILSEHIPDQRIMGLLNNIITSFSVHPGVGLPLGNLTSQLFVNVYMNVFDQWVKHSLRARGYIRYADDFVLFSYSRAALIRIIPAVERFLVETLHLSLHPTKVHIRTVASGIDFLGWVHFPDHRVLRTKTKQRMFRRIREHPTEPTLQSYLGLLSHGNTAKIRTQVRELAWLSR